MTIAAGYRVRGERVTKKENLPEAYARLIADSNEPYLLDVIVDADEDVFPMIPAGGSYRDIIVSMEEMRARANFKLGSSI